MRVLHVNQNASFVGGIEQILFDTARGFAEAGISQALLYGGGDVSPHFLQHFDQASSKLSILADFQPDVILIHKLNDPEKTALLASKRPSVRMVHDHDLTCLRRHKYFPLGNKPCELATGMNCITHGCFIQKGEPGGLPVKLRGLGSQRKLMDSNRGIRRFVVNSQWMKGQMVINGYPEEDIDVVHPIPRVLETVTALPPVSEPEILYVGQIIRGKGVDLLLHALALVKQPWHTTIVGTGNHMQACRDLARKLNIDDKVSFAGWVAHEALEPYYARALFSVVPSRWPEPFGMVGPEAMARGRAVIGFRTGGIPDWLEDNVSGLLVEPGNVKAYAAAIEKLLVDRELATQLGQSASKLAGDRFKHNNFLKSLIHSLESVL